MDFSKSKGPGLLPRPSTTILYYATNAIEFLRRFNLEREIEERRNEFLPLFWSNLLMHEEPSIRTEFGATGFISYGFLDPNIEADAFGIILYSYNQHEEDGFLGTYRVGRNRIEARVEYEFPVFRRVIIEELHAACNPGNNLGTGTCSARTQVNSSTPKGPGLLTAQHIASSSTKKIKLDCGHDAKVLERAAYGIDAMLLESPCCSTRKKITPVQHVAAWTNAQILGSSRTIHCQITDVTNTQGVFDSPLLPIRIFLDKSGIGGDSGAMVEDSNGDPMGIYMGMYRSKAGVTGGFAQHLYQVTKIMDMEIYQ